ncbi:MAG: hypothetical protein OEV92_00070 [Nitrospinota bacterium]|nr:hypothetical protein [Nitrospinota bacterium]
MGIISQLTANSARRDTAELVFSGLVLQSVILISGVLLARILGAEGRGHLVQMVLTPELLSLLVGIGVPQALTFELSKDAAKSQNIKGVVKRIFIYQAALILVFHGLAGYYYYYQIGGDLWTAMAITLVSGPATLYILYSYSIWQDFGLFRNINFFGLAMPLGYSLGLTVLYLTAAAG